MAKISTIGVLTSGGDAPGMNAAIRAVTRAAIYNGWKVKGIYRGWEGLINNEIKEFTSESVSGTINRGGTILRTARSKGFMNEEGRAKAYENIKANGIDALIVIGGNVAETKEYLLLPVKSAIQKHSLNLVNKDTSIKFSKLGEKAGPIGACMLSRTKLLGLI